ncbi:MAG: hypothetical protein H0T69_09995 [Thermoleophilaceae bacterium]|nr:hypothetical protein [Thermoleophilaceae bacterium]
MEVIPHAEDTYDYEGRYSIGRTDFVCPAELSAEESAEVSAIAASAYETLGAAGAVRVDLMLGPGGPQALEVNAIPGLTDTSLLPMAAEAAGMGFEALVERLVELAVARTTAARG